MRLQLGRLIAQLPSCICLVAYNYLVAASCRLRICTGLRGAEALRAHQTFVIKPGVDGLLDVARQTYSTVIDDIHEYTETVKEEFDLPELKLVFKTRGYEFVHPIAGVEQLPDIATQKTRQKSRWIFLTKELSALNDRMKPGRNR